MTSLKKRTYRLWVALCLVIGLAVLPAIITPLVGDELAGRIPGTDVVFADEAAGGNG